MIDMRNNREVPDVLLFCHNSLQFDRGSGRIRPCYIRCNMSLRFRTALFIFLILAFCSGNGLRAQGADEIPKKIQRNWAQPDCGDVEEAVVLSRYFYLKSTEKDITLLPA